ncbi:MAG: AMP-binding protein [Lachnospiraceae bacterium]|nr:AMP-binding protein [Lachnospiraceae bacterium]
MQISRIDRMIKELEGFTPSSREEIEDFQLKKLNQLLKRETERGGFYKNLPSSLSSLSELKSLPFTREEDLVSKGNRMVLLSQSEISKVISEHTSGTTGAGKRVYYTEQDCMHTVQLFEAGLGEFIFPGSRTLVCMPYSGPFGLGELISMAIRNLGAEPIEAGVGKTYGELKGLMDTHQPDTFVGMPVVLLSLLRLYGKGSLERALVSGDACPDTVIREIEKLLGSRLWPHYGSREMGLGGAICCAAHEGMHLRENHVIPEIVDENGNTVPDGVFGELVITTIGMEAQPLIRYRTGDRTRILPGRCSCGSCVKRLDEVSRIGVTGEMRTLDNSLFAVPELVDYSLTWKVTGSAETAVLEALVSVPGMAETEQKIRNIWSALKKDVPLQVRIREAQEGDRPLYAAKRRVQPLIRTADP